MKITKLTNSDETYLGVETGPSMGANVGFSSLHRKGFAPYTYYMYQQLYDAEGKPVQNAFADRNGDGKINADDRYMTGCSATPWAYYGISTQVRYKNWDLGINGHGSIGAELINKVALGYSSSYSDNWTKGYIDNLCPKWLLPEWHAPNSETQKYSDLWIEDATFFKIDDINLGYTFNLKNNLKSVLQVLSRMYAHSPNTQDLIRKSTISMVWTITFILVLVSILFVLTFHSKQEEQYYEIHKQIIHTFSSGDTVFIMPQGFGYTSFEHD